MEKKEEGEEHLGPIPEQLYLKSSWVIPQDNLWPKAESANGKPLLIAINQNA